MNPILIVLCLLLGGAAGQSGPQFCPTATTDEPLFALARKILGGTNAAPGRHPYMASLQSLQTRSHFCGGILIKKDLILTAAHCVHPMDDSTTTFPIISIGGTLHSDDPDAEVRTACRTFIHSTYIPGKPALGYDIALIQLDVDSTKQSCQLGRQREGSVTALGWGLNEQGLVQLSLKRVELDVVNNRQCANRVEIYREILQDSMTCAGREGRDVCKGDSGGPILQLGSGCGENDAITGITSIGLPCVDPLTGRLTRFTAPGIFTRVSSFEDWIENLGEGAATMLESETCTRDPPSKLKREDFKKDKKKPRGDLPDARERRGCLYVEGIDLGKGPEAINDGHEDVVNSPEECCDLCKSTPGCRTWVYFRLEEKYSPKGACWLRKIVGPASRCTICTSGLVMKEFLNEPDNTCQYFMGMDLKGKDLKTVKALRVEECCEKCKQEKRCKSFAFTPSTERCFLKHGIGTLEICEQCQSGVNVKRVTEDDDLDVLNQLLPGVRQVAQNLRLTTIPGDCRLTVGVDMKGGEVLSKHINTRTPEDCCWLCKTTKGCRSWTRINVPTTHLNSGDCFLKKDIPEEVPCAGCTSGVVEGEGASAIAESTCGLLEGVDLEGNDMSGGRITDSPKACCALCEETRGCKSWTRVKSDGKCFLKKVAAPVMKLCPKCDSGINLDKVTKREISSLAPVITKN